MMFRTSRLGRICDPYPWRVNFFLGVLIKALGFLRRCIYSRLIHPILPPSTCGPLAGVWWVDASRSLGGSQTCLVVDFGVLGGWIDGVLGLLMATQNSGEPANHHSPVEGKGRLKKSPWSYRGFYSYTAIIHPKWLGSLQISRSINRMGK